MRVFIQVFCTVLFFLGALSSAEADEERLQQIINAEVENLSTQGYGYSAGALVEPLVELETKSVRLQMKSGILYAFVAACSEPCTHVSLGLFSEDGTQLGVTDVIAPVASIGGALPKDGIYELRLQVSVCPKAKCSLAFAILERALPPHENTVDHSVAQTAAASTTQPAPVQNATDQLIEQIIAQLPSLIITAIEADQIRSKYPVGSEIPAPVATSAAQAPGKPAGYKEPIPQQPSSPRVQSSQTQGNANNCQAMASQYHAAVRSAGDPASTANIINIYRYLQCRCGWPASPHVSSC